MQESRLWFSRYANVPFRILLSPQRLGNGAQPALLRNIAWDQVPLNEQTTVLNSVLGEWEKVSTRGNPGLLQAATQSFTDLVTSCEPAGCELGDGITTNDAWSFVRMKLFETWLDYFAETPPPVSGGCSTTRILRDAALGEWRLDTESSSCKNISDCLTFGEPSETAQAATQFAATLPKGYAHLQLLITPVRAVVKSGDPIAYQLKVKNSGGITSPSSIVNVVLPSCLKVETQPPESSFDEKQGIIRWPMQGLGKGDSRRSSVSVRGTECPTAQYPLSVEFVLIREDGIEAVSVTRKIRLPQPTDDIMSNAEARRRLVLMMHPNEQMRERAFEELLRFVLEDDKKRALRELFEPLMADLSSTDKGRQNRAREEIHKLLAQ